MFEQLTTARRYVSQQTPSGASGCARRPRPSAGARAQVVRERQAAPFSRADAVLWADEEEVDAWRGAARAAAHDRAHVRRRPRGRRRGRGLRAGAPRVSYPILATIPGCVRAPVPCRCALIDQIRVFAQQTCVHA